MRLQIIAVISVTLCVQCASAETDRARKTVSDIVFQCGGGQVVSIDGETSAKITDSYVQSVQEGKKFVFKNMGAIFSGLTPDQTIGVFKIFTDCIEKHLGAYQPAYSEPSQEEMREAIDNTLSARSRKDVNGYVIENPLNGFRVEIIQFKKQDCRIAGSGSGYDCTYLLQIRQSVFSNETSQAGRDHADAINSIFGMLGGRTLPLEVVAKRFVKTEQGWILADAP